MSQLKTFWWVYQYFSFLNLWHFNELTLLWIHHRNFSLEGISSKNRSDYTYTKVSAPRNGSKVLLHCELKTKYRIILDNLELFYSSGPFVFWWVIDLLYYICEAFVSLWDPPLKRLVTIMKLVLEATLV